MSNNIKGTTNDQVNSVPEETEVKNNSSKTIKYSYNPLVTSDLTKTEGGYKTRGWMFTAIGWNEAELINMIRTQSYIPSELKDGYKVLSNVKAVYNVVLDFDEGTPSLQEFLTQAEEFRFTCVVHTTTNHQKPKHDLETKEEIPDSAIDKFRVIIPMVEPISLSAYEASQVFWLNKFPTLDTTSFQGNRYFMVNPKAEVFFHDTYVDINGDSVETRFLDPYKDGIIPESFKKKSKGRPKTTGESIEKSDGSFSINDTFRLEDGREMKYKDITGKTQVLCPFCDPAKRQSPDKNNAFVDFNKAGQVFLYCSSEDKTYWSHSSEIVSSKSQLFFNETLGYASRLVEEETSKGYGVFKNDDDWKNYCHANNVNPSCKIFLPRVRIIFDPAKPSGLQKEYFNMFQESEYLSEHNKTQPLLSGDEVLAYIQDQTPIIHELMMNVFGESEYLKRFLNWNAVILTRRIKLDTAWLITSKEEGIGKGLIFDRILQPIYGQRQSMLVQGEGMAKKFNSQDQTLWLKVFDEVYAPSNARENLSRKEWLKYIITAREQTIELKGIDSFQMANHMNLVLYSNNECPIFMGSNDRRFSVVRNDNAVKPEKLSFYKSNLEMRKAIDEELNSFADILLRYDSDLELANTAIDSSAKNKLKEITADEYEEFAHALVDKDASYFLLTEIFPPSESDRMFNRGTDISLSPDGQIVESAIKDGYIPSRLMGRICKYHFSGHYKQIVARLKLKSVISGTKNIDGKRVDVYTVR